MDRDLFLFVLIFNYSFFLVSYFFKLFFSLLEVKLGLVLSLRKQYFIIYLGVRGYGLEVGKLDLLGVLLGLLAGHGDLQGLAASEALLDQAQAGLHEIC